MKPQQIDLPPAPWTKVAQLCVVALAAVYGSILLGEFAAGSGLASRIIGVQDLSVMVGAFFIHTLITMPIAFVVGYSLVQRAPMAGPKAVIIVALVWSAFIVALQLAVYESAVAGLSLLKVLCVVAPLFVGRTIAHRTLVRKPEA